MLLSLSVTANSFKKRRHCVIGENNMEEPKVSLATIEAQITKCLQEQPGIGNDVLIAEMMRTIVKLAGDATSRGDLKILNRALKELRHAFRIFAPYRSVRK